MSYSFNYYKKISKKLILLFNIALFLPAFFVVTRDIHQTITSPVTVASIISYSILLLMFIYVIFLNIKYKFKIKLSNGFEKYYLYYISLSLISSFYSSYFLLSFGKVIPLVISVFVWKVLLNISYKNKALIKYNWDLFLKFLFLWLILLWISAISFPNKGFLVKPGALLPQLSGSWFVIHPNTSAQLAAILALVGFIRFIYGKNNTINYLFISIGLITLIFTQARTSLIAFLIAMGFIYFNLKGKYSKLKLPLLLISLPLFIILLNNYKHIFTTYIFRGQTLDLFLSASGRVFHWKMFFEFIFDNILELLFGKGFYTAIRIDLNKYIGYTNISNLDNTFLEVLAFTGIVGFAFFSFFTIKLYKLLKKSLKHTNDNITLEMYIAYIVILVRAFFGPTFHVFNINLLSIIIIGIYLRSMYKNMYK